MKVLVATAMYPTPQNPVLGTFVRTQVEALKQTGIDIELLLLSSQQRTLKYPKAFVELQQYVASASFDLIHAHFSYVGLLARTQWSLPLIVTYHGDDLLGRVINARGQHSLFSMIMVRAGQLLSRYVDAAIVQSKEMASKLAFRENVYVVPHEVDFDLFQPVERDEARARLGLSPEKKYLLFAANPAIHVKRFPLAKAAVERLSAADPAVELLVVHKESQDRLALYMNASDAMVFTSFQEGSPNIVKQAMACNLPIVATPVGDVRELIGTTAGCHICSPNVDEFVTSLATVLQTPQRTTGRDQIRHLDLPSVTKRVIDVYERALKKRRRLQSPSARQPSGKGL